MCVCALHDSPGGASRVRTGDPLLAKQVLSQLSYGPSVQASTLAAQLLDPGTKLRLVRSAFAKRCFAWHCVPPSLTPAELWPR